MQLNIFAGRTYNDINQYFVFPWILTNYTSDHLNLEKTCNYRDLTKPMGALNPQRLEPLTDRYERWDIPDIKPFMYGHHYSGAGPVLHFLIRTEPFTS